MSKLRLLVPSEAKTSLLASTAAVKCPTAEAGFFWGGESCLGRFLADCSYGMSCLCIFLGIYGLKVLECTSFWAAACVLGVSVPLLSCFLRGT